jgi:hypothetical protein
MTNILIGNGFFASLPGGIQVAAYFTANGTLPGSAVPVTLGKLNPTRLQGASQGRAQT